MRIVGITVNDRVLDVLDNAHSISYYRAFIEYCIDNCLERMQFSDEFRKRVKTTPDDPDFGRAIHYERIIEYRDYYYSDWLNNENKITRMTKIANEIGLDLNIDIIP